MKRLIPLILVAGLSTSACAGLVSRYSFADDANDSIGTRHGLLKGTAAVVDGRLRLDGAGWVTLPGGLVTPLASATAEVWFTYQNTPEFLEAFANYYTDKANINPMAFNKRIRELRLLVKEIQKGGGQR